MTTIFRNSTIDKEKLKDIILKNPDAIHPGLSFIDVNLSTEEDMVIDFLGADLTGRLTILNFDVQENNDLLISALSQVQWLNKNKGILKRLFFSEKVDFNQTPKIILICSCFSEKLKSAIKVCSGVTIKIIEYKHLVSSGEDAIIFEEVFSHESKSDFVPPQRRLSKINEVIIPNEPSFVPETRKNDDKIRPQITLTPEEIAEFVNFDQVLREKRAAD